MSLGLSVCAFEDFYREQVERVKRRLDRTEKVHNNRRRVRNRPVVAELELSNWTGSGGYAGERCPSLSRIDGERE